jgi:hypothetical protein
MCVCEVKCYSEADAIRKEVLLRPLAVANRSIETLTKGLKRGKVLEDVTHLQITLNPTRGGILSGESIAQSNELVQILNGK